jgi:ribonuclease HII
MSPFAVVAGIDEAGRGALAGLVVAGTCVITSPLYRRRHALRRWSPFRRISENDCIIADSKQLTPDERSMTFRWIEQHCDYGVGLSTHEEIEERGILAATQEAMRRALEHLRSRVRPTHLKIDGRDKFTFDCRYESIIRGDQTEPCIAAASIVAKVLRDRIMEEYRLHYPEYGFELHKGYGTPEHIASLRAFGPCPIHRKSFLSRILQEEQPVLLTV